MPAATTWTVTTRTRHAIAASSDGLRARRPAAPRARWSPPTPPARTRSAPALAPRRPASGRAGRLSRHSRPRPSRHQRVDAEEQHAARGHQSRQDRHRLPRHVAEDRDQTGADAQHGDAAAHRDRTPDRRRGPGASACRRPCAAYGGRRTGRSRPAPRRGAGGALRGARARRRRRPPRRSTTSSNSTAISQPAPKPVASTARRPHTVGSRSRKSASVAAQLEHGDAAAPKATTMARTTQRPWRRRRMASIVQATTWAAEVAAASQSRIDDLRPGPRRRRAARRPPSRAAPRPGAATRC